MEDNYLALRRRYHPETIKLVIIAESPPVSGKYFYNPTGAASELLFSTLMGQLGAPRLTKENGLLVVQRRGWVLLDATYEPVNKFTATERDRVIIRDYHRL